MVQMSHARLAFGALMFAAVAALAGCEPLAVTSFGIGASTAVSTTLSGITYRTFTAPEARVRGATLLALKRMDIKLAARKKVSDGELLKAKATHRDIEITLEPLTPNVTRMEVIARSGALFYDSATATEVILQTERELGHVS